jgi:hypothetical protein
VIGIAGIEKREACPVRIYTAEALKVDIFASLAAVASEVE